MAQKSNPNSSSKNKILKEKIELLIKKEEDSLLARFNSVTELARDIGFVAQGELNHAIGDWQKLQDELSITLSDAQIKYKMDKTIDFIDSFIICSEDEIKVELFSKYIALTNFIDQITQEIKKYQIENDELGSELNISGTNEFTITRQTLAVYYILTYFNLEMEFLNKTDLAKFIHMLCAKEPPVKIANSGIYKKVKNLFSVNKSNLQSISDLEFVHSLIKPLSINNTELDKICETIRKDIESYK